MDEIVPVLKLVNKKNENAEEIQNNIFQNISFHTLFMDGKNARTIHYTFRSEAWGKREKICLIAKLYTFRGYHSTLFGIMGDLEELD